MYQAIIKDRVFAVQKGKPLHVNDVPCEVEWLQNTGPGWQVRMGQKVVTADLVRYERDSKTIILRISGKKYSVQIKEPVDILLDQLGMSQKVQRKVNLLKAPMPGLIVKVLVKPGEEVKQGDSLLILEAMKMENVFRASADAVVKEIMVGERQSVEKGQVLITFV